VTVKSAHAISYGSRFTSVFILFGLFSCYGLLVPAALTFLLGVALRCRRRLLDAAGRLAAHTVCACHIAKSNHCFFCRRYLIFKWQTLELERILQTNHGTAHAILHTAHEKRKRLVKFTPENYLNNSFHARLIYCH
jgi:hypothetical protein